MPPNNQQQAANQQPPTQAPIGSGPSPQSGQEQTSTNPNSTQNNLQFAEIRDDMIIMRDGTFRTVIACQSINFDLMSSQEREGVEYAYQNFLNSLHYSVQILIRSQRIDISPYLDKLNQLRRDEDNMLLGVLMDDYIDFVDVLAQEANIMDKSFYVVVPFFPEGESNNLSGQTKGFFSKIFSKPNHVTVIDDQSYEKAKTEMNNRTESVIGGLFSIGVQSIRLSTAEISELYYNYYNPDTAIREPLRDFATTTSLYTGRGGDALTAPVPQEDIISQPQLQNSPQDLQEDTSHPVVARPEQGDNNG